MLLLNMLLVGFLCIGSMVPKQHIINMNLDTIPSGDYTIQIYDDEIWLINKDTHELVASYQRFDRSTGEIL
jgi:hypothetical protein